MSTDAQSIPEGSTITWESIRRGLQMTAEAKGEWAGIPSPFQTKPLVLENRYPWKGLEELSRKFLPADEQEPEPRPDDPIVRNAFYISGRGSMVYILQDPDGKIWHFQKPLWGSARVLMMLDTLSCADAWTLDAEITAQEKLAEHVTHRQLGQYLKTGTFLERSPRSGLHYLFRKCRPTVAMTFGHGLHDDKMRILCTLCMHGLGYYKGTFCGALCPTDDVISHLLFMRADERKFWAKANHHAVWEPEAGL